MKTDYYATIYASSLGELTLESDGDSLTGLYFTYPPGEEEPEGNEGDALPIFDKTRRWLDCYFSGLTPDFTPPLRPEGSPFYQRVWEILRTIPFGETTTYGAIARRIARERGIPKMAAQAVGRAVGANPIALIIPCHRVVGANGDLTGYAGGIYRKARLLDLEQYGEII